MYLKDTPLNPKDTFEVRYFQQMNQEDYKSLNYLYQPIIGITSHALYQNLLLHGSQTTNVFEHAYLMDWMNLSIPNLYQARIKLEAIGLLKTYTRKTDYGYHFVYIMQDVLTPRVFLSDDILGLLLLDTVGEQRIKQLQHEFGGPKVDLEAYQDISSPFTRIFPIKEDRLMAQASILSDIQNDVQSSHTKKKTSELTTLSKFDWNFFKNSLSSYGLNDTYLENVLKPFIIGYHELYGLNELELTQAVQSNMDYVTNQLDIKAFKKEMYQRYHQVSSANMSLKNQSGLKDTETKDKKINHLKTEGFSELEIQVIISCEQFAPMVFLKALKEQKGGFVSSNERFTIEQLKTQSPLNDSVINMLIHYSLVVLGHTSLKQSLIHATANDWAQNNIRTAKDAMNKVKDFQNQKIVKNQNYAPNKKSFKKQGKKETLPDWAKDNKQRKETPLTAEEKAYFEEQIKQLKPGGEDQ